MKRVFLCLSLLALMMFTFAQAPVAFNYQAILRNSDGAVRANETVALQLSIVNDVGVPSYLEIHNTTTNELGLVNLIIGEGTSSESLSAVNWTNGPYFIDITVNGVNLGSSPLLSVPYALYAASGNEGPQGLQGEQGPVGPQGDIGPQGLPGGESVWDNVAGGINYPDGKVGIGTSSPAESLDVNGNVNIQGGLLLNGDNVIQELLDRIEYLEVISGISAVTDYDGNTYGTVKIGDQIWMAENLKATHYANGATIPSVESNSAWDALEYTSKAYCWYDNLASNGETFGALYTWAAAMNGTSSRNDNPSGVQGVCPTGWHLPSDEEWIELEIFLGMGSTEARDDLYNGTIEGGKLKETGNNHWTAPNEAATNETGFTALPAGRRNLTGEFVGVYTLASFWTSRGGFVSSGGDFEIGANISNFYGLTNTRGDIYRFLIYSKSGLSVRCIKD